MRGAWGILSKHGIALAVAVGVMTSVPVAFGEDRSSHPRWRLPEELLQDAEVASPQPILEIRLQYDAEVSPSLSLKHLEAKYGYAPQYEPRESGYVLSLLSAQGDDLFALTFDIPNTIFNPPPLLGGEGDDSPLVLRKMLFALTVPFMEGAAELRISDPQGLLIIQESLLDIPVKGNPVPQFRSLRHKGSSSGFFPRGKKPLSLGTQLLDLLMESAEAATSNGPLLDITFVGDNYTAADLARFHQDVDRAVSHLVTYEPYASRAQQLLFHSVDNTTVDLGCVHDATMNRLIVCNSAAVVSVVNDAGAPYDKIIVLVNDPMYGGSGGSVTVSYNGSSAPQVVAHEFGHSFGGLLDEYNLYSSNGTLDGKTYANCYAGVPPNATWGEVVASDYAIGCKYPNWYRSSPCSIMKSLDCMYFNAVSQRQISSKLDLYSGSVSPTLSFSASPLLIGTGGSSTLSWSAANVTACMASGGWSGAQPAQGAATVTPSSSASYTLECTNGTSSVTKTVNVSVDNQAPSVLLTSPSSGTTVSGDVAISVSAGDNIKVERVDIYKDGQLMGSDNSEPFNLSWNTTTDLSGSHALSAQARDSAGNIGTSAVVTVTVDNSTSSSTEDMFTSTKTRKEWRDDLRIKVRGRKW